MACSMLALGLFISGYFRNGTVYIAWQKLKKGKIERAEVLISKIKYPKYLSKGQKSYYHFTKGILYSEKQEWENSLAELSKAIEIKFFQFNNLSFSTSSFDFGLNLG